MIRPTYWNLPRKQWTAEELAEYEQLMQPRPLRETPKPKDEVEGYTSEYPVMLPRAQRWWL